MYNKSNYLNIKGQGRLYGCWLGLAEGVQMKERMYIKAQKRGGAPLFYRHRERAGVATTECKQRRILDAGKERRLWCEDWGRKAGDERRRRFLRNLSHLCNWECLMIRLWRSTNPLIAL